MIKNCFKPTLIFLIATLYINLSFATNDSLLVLQNINVIDVISGNLIKNVDVVITGNIIRKITPYDSNTEYLNAQIVDSKGLFCIPGLVDSHVHLAEPIESLAFLLKNGITTVRDMANDAEYLRNIINDIDSGNSIGPNIYYSAVMAGKYFIESDRRVMAATPGYFALGEAPWARKIDDQSDIAKVVKQARDQGVCALKFYKDLSSAQVNKLTEEGHKQGLLIWAHATVYPATCDQIINAGVDCISHYPYVLTADNFPEKLDPMRTFFDDDIIGFRKLETRLVQMKTSGIFFDPTIVASDQLIKMVMANGADEYIALGYYAIKRAHELGVPVVAGTDASVVINDTITLYYELEALVNHVGFTPFEALQCATINGAKVLHKEKIFGSIEVNKMADLVVLSKDPAVDIKNILSIKYVIKNGKILFQY